MAGFDGLKEEIRRLAKREVTAAVAPLHQQIKKMKVEQRALRDQLNSMTNERKRSKVVRNVEATLENETVSPSKPRRWSAERFKTWRERSGLSAPAVAEILGVSAQTIYNYESTKTRPSDELVAKIAALKEQGKRKVKTLLDTES